MIEMTRKEEQILLAIHFLGNQASLINIRERIFKYTGKKFSVGTIYAPLNRLHLNELLHSFQERKSNSKKPVRYYKLTPKGYNALAQLKKQTEKLWDGFVYPVFEKQDSFQREGAKSTKKNL